MSDVSCSWCMGQGDACQICGFAGDGPVTGGGAVYDERGRIAAHLGRSE